MPLVVVDQGEEFILGQLLEVGFTLHLFANDVTAGLTPPQIEALTEADFTEATFAGYASSAIAGSSWTIGADDPSFATNSLLTFTRSSTGAAQTIYGYYLTITGFGVLVWFEEFSGGPIVVTNSGDAIQIAPRITLDDAEAPIVQTGTITAFGGAAAPTGWLLCNGAAVSRTTFADLFAVIGTTYGSGDGSTTFNVPDLRQRFPLGKANSGTGSTLGGTGGDIDHIHFLNTPTSGARVLISTAAPELRLERKTVASYNTTHGATVTDTTNTDATTTGTALTGDSGANNPPFQAVNFIILT